LVEILNKANLLFVLLKACFHTHVKRKLGGLLICTKEEEKWISGLNYRGKTGEQSTCKCLLELGYELALAYKDDVSDSPGFESCGLIFDKTVSRLLIILIHARYCIPNHPRGCWSADIHTT
jgi:hypothetical protein